MQSTFDCEGAREKIQSPPAVQTKKVWVARRAVALLACRVLLRSGLRCYVSHVDVLYVFDSLGAIFVGWRVGFGRKILWSVEEFWSATISRRKLFAAALFVWRWHTDTYIYTHRQIDGESCCEQSRHRFDTRASVGGAWQQTWQAGATDRGRGARSVPAVATNFPRAAHLAGARGAYQNLRYVNRSSSLFWTRLAARSSTGQSGARFWFSNGSFVCVVVFRNFVSACTKKTQTNRSLFFRFPVANART